MTLLIIWNFAYIPCVYLRMKVFLYLLFSVFLSVSVHTACDCVCVCVCARARARKYVYFCSKFMLRRSNNWRCVYMRYTRGGTKIPGIVTSNLLKYAYKFETLAPFKVLSLWLDAAIPSLLSLLETLPKISNRNAVKGHQQFSLNLCNVNRMPPFQILVYLWGKKKKKLHGA